MFRPIAVCGLLLFALLPISAKAQIEIFGLSFAMTPVETMRYLDTRGLTAYIPRDEQRYCFYTDDWKEIGKLDERRYASCENQYPRQCESRDCSKMPYAVNCFSNGALSPKCEQRLKTGFLQIQENLGAEIPAYGPAEFIGLTVGHRMISVQCKVYNGCDFDLDEVVEFFNENVGDQLQTRLQLDYKDTSWGRVKAYCARGHKLDELCVLEGAYGGNSVEINRDAFGSGGMSLTLN